MEQYLADQWHFIIQNQEYWKWKPFLPNFAYSQKGSNVYSCGLDRNWLKQKIVTEYRLKTEITTDIFFTAALLSYCNKTKVSPKSQAILFKKIHELWVKTKYVFFIFIKQDMSLHIFILKDSQLWALVGRKRKETSYLLLFILHHCWLGVQIAHSWHVRNGDSA